MMSGLSELIVAKQARGRGVGRGLLEQVQTSLARRGRAILIADVWCDAVRSIVRWAGSLPMQFF
jgi:predicted GNAT superfamily acetyltransferase